jgi:hypothetical protein
MIGELQSTHGGSMYRSVGGDFLDNMVQFDDPHASFGGRAVGFNKNEYVKV